ncbi:bifunctional hydroxymethylpyrimidine kinase/phosphomethylpyrimidine kinase [Temperatibacter marinus]|uniref:hydroxymethylpyrimidine kinase n=1 Tax=Temperatibacter marinus TaxID=1456591 RepID=A0AA52EIY0_9PROT|nr:bifunctional hydroxymethylpyrimidine kinase/phosphomethylpyrimidine kinase [Temperatibacter marinus]WND02891.1 bifunctional hydroxymethylpyrimidine kinase/phosphomethylpyrimidine kinase [Temperatibacter marinus]
MNGRVLIIAGSDSGGGAGIQADIKTVTMLGGYASTAVTCVTAQNTLGVSDIHSIPPKMVYEQIKSVLEDIGTDVIKTGMLYSAEIIKAVDRALEDFQYTGDLIVDPVMVATSGAQLLNHDGIALYKELLLPRATLVTPNVPELETLTGRTIVSEEDLITAAEALLLAGTKAVVAKGGHLQEELDIVRNFYISQDSRFSFEADRLPSRNTHGTGCTLASALAVSLAQEMPLYEACERANNFVSRAIEQAPNLGKGAGPMGHAQARG